MARWSGSARSFREFASGCCPPMQAGHVEEVKADDRRRGAAAFLHGTEALFAAGNVVPPHPAIPGAEAAS